MLVCWLRHFKHILDCCFISILGYYCLRCWALCLWSYLFSWCSLWLSVWNCFWYAQYFSAGLRVLYFYHTDYCSQWSIPHAIFLNSYWYSKLPQSFPLVLLFSLSFRKSSESKSSCSIFSTLLSFSRIIRSLLLLSFLLFECRFLWLTSCWSWCSWILIEALASVVGWSALRNYLLACYHPPSLPVCSCSLRAN